MADNLADTRASSDRVQVTKFPFVRVFVLRACGKAPGRVRSSASSASSASLRVLRLLRLLRLLAISASP